MRLKPVGACLALTGVAGCLLATGLGLFANAGYPFELATHFRYHLAVASPVLLGLSVVCLSGPLRMAAIMLVSLLGIVNASHVVKMPKNVSVQTRSGQQESDRTARSLSLIWANVDRKREAIAALATLDKAYGADIVAIAEAPYDLTLQDWASAFADKPHVWLSPPPLREHRFPTRIAIASRYPLEQARMDQLPQSLQPRAWFEAVFRPERGEAGAGGGGLALLFAHPIAPDFPGMVKDRNAYIDHVAARVEQLTMSPDVTSFLLAGDWNVAPWAPDFTRLPGQRIGDARLEASWLNRWPLLGLPLDHVMVSKGVEPTDYRIGPSIGSDHRPVLAKVTW